MSWSARTRSLHRWLSVIFTLAVMANFAVMPLGDDTLSTAVGGLTLVPLVLRRRGHGSREALEGDAGPGSLGLAGVLRVAGEDRLERLPEAPQA